MDSYWSEGNEQLYNRLYKFIIDNWNTTNETPSIKTYIKRVPLNMLVHIIQNNDKWGNSYKSSYYFMIVRWLEINDVNNEHIDFIKKVANHNKYKKYEDVLINT